MEKFMGAFQPIHWLMVAVIALLLFGRPGKITGLMGDAAKGIRAFREGLKGDDVVADKTTDATPLPRERDKDETRS
jgi:sec-independent protein translocase protein TatA